jgi:hypothetical protein
MYPIKKLGLILPSIKVTCCIHIFEFGVLKILEKISYAKKFLLVYHNNTNNKIIFYCGKNNQEEEIKVFEMHHMIHSTPKQF